MNAFSDRSWRIQRCRTRRQTRTSGVKPEMAAGVYRFNNAPYCTASTSLIRSVLKGQWRDKTARRLICLRYAPVAAA